MLVSQLPILPTIIILLLLGQVVHIIDASETVHPRTQPKPFGLNHKTNHKIYSSSTARRNNNNIQQPIVPIEEKPVWYPSDPFSQDDDDDDDKEDENVESCHDEIIEHTIIDDKNIEITVCTSMRDPSSSIINPYTDRSNKKKNSVSIQSPVGLHGRKRHGFNLMTIYEHFLSQHEILTKCITSGLIGLVGDFFAQCFEHSTKQVNMNTNFIMDKPRLLGLFIESTFISSPLMHYAYDLLEYMAPTSCDDDKVQQHYQQQPQQHQIIRGGGNGAISNLMSQWAAATFHVLADVFILGPISVFTLIVCTSIVEGRINTLIHELLLDFGPATWASILASLSFVPSQLLAFKHLPLKYRLLYMNLQDIIWNAVVSVMAHRSRK